MFEPVLIHAHNPGPMTGSGNNTYLLADAGAAVLIDAGVGQPQHLAAVNAELRRQRASLTTVLVTHGHRDHAEGAAALRDAHPSAAFAKKPWPAEDERYPVAWQPLRGGDTIRAGALSLDIVDTPGHSPDHVVVWHRESRTAFTGDLVVLGSSVMIHASRGGSLGDYLASLERVLALEPRVLLPAHGPRIEDPAPVVAGYLEHRRMRERQVVDALRAGRSTVHAIADSIYDGLDAALMAAARENVHAHLEKLKADGLATDHEGRWRLS